MPPPALNPMVIVMVFPVKDRSSFAAAGWLIPTHARTARWAEQMANETKARLIPSFRHRVIERPGDPARTEQAVPRATGMRWSSGVGGRAPARLPFGRTEEALRR